MQENYILVSKIFAYRSLKAAKLPLVQGLPDTAHQIVIEPEVVCNGKTHGQHFLGFEESAAHRRGSSGGIRGSRSRGDRALVPLIFGVFDVYDTFPGEEVAVPTIARGHNAVEEIHAAPDGFDDVPRRTDAHEVRGACPSACVPRRPQWCRTSPEPSRPPRGRLWRNRANRAPLCASCARCGCRGKPRPGLYRTAPGQDSQRPARNYTLQAPACSAQASGRSCRSFGGRIHRARGILMHSSKAMADVGAAGSDCILHALLRAHENRAWPSTWQLKLTPSSFIFRSSAREKI